MSGEIDLTRGFLFNENDADEVVTFGKLNKLIGDLVARVAAGAVSNREIADGTISADKLSGQVSAQLGVADGSVTTNKIVDDAVTGDKIADDTIDSEHYVAGSIDTEHLADGAVTTAKVADGSITQAKLAIGAGMCVSAFRATMSSDQNNLASGSFSTVQFGNEEYDMASEYNPGSGNYSFTAAVAGIYAFDARVCFEDLDTRARVRINVDGTPKVEGETNGLSSTRGSVTLSWLGVLAAGAVVTVTVRPMSDSNADIGSDDPEGDGIKTSYFQGMILRRTA